MKNFSLILVLFLFAPLFLYAGDEPVLEMDRTFQTTPGLTLNYNGISGDLVISTWDRSDANVKVYANSNAKERMEIQVVDGNGGITISESSRYSSARGSDLRLRYEITLPSSYNVTINTNSSDQQIENLSGNIYIQCSSGDAMLNNITGTVTISNSSGDVLSNNITGNVFITTASGDVVNTNTTGKVTVTSASGDIGVSNPSKSTSLSTVSGDITLVCMDSNPGSTLNTTSGDIDLQLGNKVTATVITNENKTVRNVSESYGNDRPYEENFNGGGNTIYCTTTSGEISVESGD